MDRLTRRLFGTLLLVGLPGSAAAATIISYDPLGEASPGLSGYRTYRLTATSDAGKIIF